MSDEYANLDAVEAVEDAAAESSAALDLFAEQLRTLKGDSQGLTQLLSACAQQVSVCRRLVRALEVEVQAANLDILYLEICKQQRERLAALVHVPHATVGAHCLNKRPGALFACSQSNTFDFERKEAQRAALLQQAASARGGDEAGQVDPELLTPSQIIAKGEAVQLESQASVARMAKIDRKSVV